MYVNMIKLFKYIRETLGVDLSPSNKKEIVLLHDGYDKLVVPSKTNSVEEYINEMVELNDWADSDREYLMGKVKQYQINSLDNNQLYVEVLHFISTK